MATKKSKASLAVFHHLNCRRAQGNQRSFCFTKYNNRYQLSAVVYSKVSVSVLKTQWNTTLICNFTLSNIWY